MNLIVNLRHIYCIVKHLKFSNQTVQKKKNNIKVLYSQLYIGK